MHTFNIRKKFVTTAVTAIAGVAALTSCQYSSPSPDFESLESQIVQGLNEDLAAHPAKIAADVSSVDCPQAQAPKTGDMFVCMADLDGHDMRVQVTVDEDMVDYVTLDMVYDLRYAEQVMAAQISEALEFPVTLSCGEGLKVVPIGDSFECTAADELGDTRTIKITANPEGEFWEVQEEVQEEAPLFALGGSVH